MRFIIKTDDPNSLFLSLINDFIKLAPKERTFMSILMDHKGIVSDEFKVAAKNKLKLTSQSYAQMVYNLTIKKAIIKEATGQSSIHPKLIIPQGDIEVTFKIVKK